MNVIVKGTWDLRFKARRTILTTTSCSMEDLGVDTKDVAILVAN